METLVEWVKNIACFYIIASLVMHIIPGKSYLQHIKVFLGIVTIILLLKPIGSLFSFEDKLGTELKKNFNVQMEEELLRDLELVGEYQKEAVVGDYLNVIKNNIKDYVENMGVVYDACHVSLNLDETSENYGGIEKIELSIELEDTSAKGFYEIEIKKYLANFYNLSERNININISEGYRKWE